MRTIIIAATALAISFPVQAAAASDPVDLQRGVFVGPRVTMHFGGARQARPVAALMIAPTVRSRTAAGAGEIRIGRGVALNLTGPDTMRLAVGGRVIGDRNSLAAGMPVDARNKLGLSKGAAIAIGVGVIVVAGVIWYASYCDRKFSSICGDSE